MNIFSKISIGLILTSLTLIKIEAAGPSTSAKLSGVVGLDMAVRFYQNIIVHDIDTSLISTPGSSYELGDFQMTIVDNRLNVTDKLIASSAQADNSNEFRLLNNSDPNKYIMLKLTKDKDTSGTPIIPVDFFNNGTLRNHTINTSSATTLENETYRLNVYAKYDTNNSVASGAYETTIQFAWINI